MKNSSNIYKYLTALLVASMCANEAVAQMKESGLPKLVVNITIDQLRSDYLQIFERFYGDGGFKRLMRDGLVYEKAINDYFPADRSSATATIVSGATPYYNGIVSNSWIDRKTLRRAGCVEDKNVKAGQGRDAVSAKNLMTTTIGDELKVFTNGMSKVYSIGPERDAAIISAGHAGDLALWIDDNTGRWTTTSAYALAADQWAMGVTANFPIADKLKSLKWSPLSGLGETLSLFMGEGMQKSFSHPFTGERKFIDFKRSALVNEEVSLMALKCQKDNGLGTDDVTDLLCIQYYAGKPLESVLSSNRTELQDTYMRLDHELNRIIETLESRLGKGQVLFVLSSTGYSEIEDVDYDKYGIPSGTFYINRTANLLNMYLSNVYGKGQYVDVVYHNQIYLNHRLIEQQQLSLSEILKRSRDFLFLSEGVRDIQTSENILSSTNENLQKIRNGYSLTLSGDIICEVAPGWQVVNENTGEKFNPTPSAVIFPIIFYGSGVRANHVETVVSTDRIAPTISKSLRIRAPNGCKSLPLF